MSTTSEQEQAREAQNIAYFTDRLLGFRYTHGPFKQPTEQQWQTMIIKDNRFFSLTQIRRYSKIVIGK